MPVNTDEQKNLTTWAVVVALGALAAELLQVLLVGRPYSLGFLPKSNWVDFLYFMGAFSGVPACVLWIGRKRIPKIKKIPALSILFGCLLYAYQLIFNDGEGLYAPASVICFVLGPLGIAALLCALFFSRAPSSTDAKEWAILFFKICLLLDALSVATASGLASNRLLFPATWDYLVYKIDASFGGVAANSAIYFSDAPPSIKALTAAIYGVLIFSFYALVGLAIRKNSLERLNVWRALIIPFAAAFFLYAFLPVSGPSYAFFSGEFPFSLPDPGSLPAAPVVIPPAYRNGMPSMHFTGALLVWMLAVALRERVAVLMSILLVAGTGWATLAIGEHYVLDLIVALPYAAFLGSLLIWPQRFKATARISIPTWGAAGLFFLWMVLLRAAPVWLMQNPEVVQALAFISIVTSFIVYCQIWKENSEKKSEVELSHEAPKIEKQAPIWVIAAFFVSGIAGLIYEVVYAKALAVTFGSTALASYTVLTTYMGGMALGAWIGGLLADKLKDALRAYALCEALIGLYAALTPTLFIFVQNVYVHFSLDSPPDAPWLTPFRLMLGVLCLGIPTILMGATLPLMFKHLKYLGISSEKAIAPLYAANVAGAALGSVVAGYFLLPAVGRNGGTFIAAIVSLLLALYVLDKRKSLNPLASETSIAVGSKNQQSLWGRTEKINGIIALVVLFVGGGVTLGLEVSSMHLLAIVAGNSVYAFGLMLATFLAGLGLGSFVGEKLISRYSKLALIGFSQCGIALAVALTAQMWGDLPSYFSSFSLYPIKLSFSAREAIRALVCMCAMLPPAFFIGMSYPAAMSLATDWLSPEGGASGLGIASAINTLGNILGVVLVGFWLLPAYGSRNTILVLALVALALGALSLLFSAQERNFRDSKLAVKMTARLSPILLASLSVLFFPRNWSFDDLSSGANVYFSAQNWGRVIDHSESVEGGLTSVAKNEHGVLTLLTNGKFQGNNSPGGEMVAQESFALFPLLHTSQRSSALVIGYGTGMTSRTLHDLGFKNIDIAELSKDIVALADRYFYSINSGISQSRGVSMHYTDGRNFLLTQTKKFDVISIEITSIWFAGAANLYNRDFYALAKNRLTEDGVIQQWIQLHHISTTDLIYAIGSIRSEFKYVWIYVRGGQGIIVASNNRGALDLPGEKQLAQIAVGAKEELHPTNLKTHLVLSPAGVDNLISSFDPTMEHLTSTDQNLYLEHSTPKGNALGDVVGENVSILSGFEPQTNAEKAAAQKGPSP